MTRKRHVALLLCGLLVIVVGLLVWAAWPSPYAAAYDRLTLGMAVADAEAALPPSTDEPAGSTPNDFFAWAGRVDGEAREVRTRLGEAERDPDVLRSVWVQVRRGSYRLTKDATGWARVTDGATGRLVAVERRWHWGEDTVVVLADVDGAVSEKVHIRRVGPSLEDRVHRWVRSWWSF